MNLTIYRKEFSIFIYNDNINLSRLLMQTLVERGYEAHYYDSPQLLKQAIHIALPHIVVLGYQERIEELLLAIQKTSREIQVILVGEAAQDEAMAQLAEQGLIYDYFTEPVKFIRSFAHRVDKAVEKWMISLINEQHGDVEEAEITETDLGAKITAFQNSAGKLEFVEKPVPLASMESLTYDILSQPTENDAIALALKSLARSTGRDFLFLRYNPSSEALVLTDISYGMSQKHEGLGIKLATVKDQDHFYKNPGAYKIWSDFFLQVFNATTTPYFSLRSAGGVLGLVVCLGDLLEESVLFSDKIVRTLQVILENRHQARLLFDYMEIETKTFCLRSKNFYDRLNGEISRARRLNRPVAAATFEIRAHDPGHLHAAQQIVAKILKRFTRVTDFTGRISDRRFAVALPHADLEGAAKKASTLMGIIQAAIEEKGGLGITVGAGVNEFPANVNDSMSLLEGCEEAAEQAGAFEVLVFTKDETQNIHSRDILEN